MTGNMLVYLFTISLLLVLAAFAAEWVLIQRRRPARWVWGQVMLLCIVLPLLQARGASLEPAVPDAVPAPAVAPAPATRSESVFAAPDVPPFEIDRTWFYLASLGAAALLFTGWALLVARSRGWSAAMMDGVPVLRAPATGPAVIGFLRPEIVVPDWAFELPHEQRRMLLAHEQSHIEARDPLLLLSAALVVVAMPWNPLLWLALHRLRGAIEIDCDRRVLARGEDVGSYARCLVDSVALAAAGPVPAVGSLSLSSSHLERRVALMLNPKRPLLLLTLSAAVLGIALATSAVTATPPAPAPVGPSVQQGIQAIEKQPYKRAEAYYNRLLNGKIADPSSLYGVFFDNWATRDPKAKGC